MIDLLLLTNFTTIMENFWEWSLQGYVNAVGFLFYPIVFSAIIGYIYLKNQSALSATIAILLFFGAFGATGVLANVPALMMVFYLITTLVSGVLVLLFVSKWRA